MRQEIRKMTCIKNDLWITSANRKPHPSTIFVDVKTKHEHDQNYVLKEKENNNTNIKSECSKLEMVKKFKYFGYLIDELKNLMTKGSLHGFKYIIESSISPIERVIWAVICVLSIIFCTIIVKNFVNKWFEVPFIVIFDNEFTATYDVPFPKVIICPENTVKKSYMDITNMTDPAFLFAASLICDEMPPQNFSMPDGTPQSEDDKIIDFLYNSTPTCNEILTYCSWTSANGKEIKTFDCCQDLFDPIFTNNGMCYGFNMLTHLNKEKLQKINENSSIYKWTPEDEYNLNIENLDTYPWRTFGVGQHFGLTVHLNLNISDSQPECDGSRFGYKVLLGSPLRSIMSTVYASIPMKKQTSFSVKAQKLSTDVSLYSLPPNSRKCYFDHEKKLKYFEYYTFLNCIQDCELNYIIQFCNCILFHFKQFSPGIPICKTYKNYLCMLAVKGRINEGSLIKYYQFKNKNHNVPKHINGSDILWCKCYPSCLSINYESEAFFIDLEEGRVSKNPSWTNYALNPPQSILKVYYGKSIFYGHIRKMQFDTMSFVASVGGIMSLFLGFSLMSSVELIYYVILKPIVLTAKNAYKNRHQNKKIDIYLP